MGIIFNDMEPGTDVDVNGDGTFNIAELGDGFLNFTFDLTDAVTNGATAGDVLTINGQTLMLSAADFTAGSVAVSYTHLRAHETLRYLVCRLLLEKKK